MQCENCGHQNSETSSYCSACAAPLERPRGSADIRLTVTRIATGFVLWSAKITLRIVLVFLVLFLSSAAIVGSYDLLVGHRPLVGLGYLLAFEGATIGFIAALGLGDVPDKIVMTRGRVPPAIFYKTIFKPVYSAMRSTSETYYDNTIVLAIAGFLEAIAGLVLLS